MKHFTRPLATLLAALLTLSAMSCAADHASPSQDTTATAETPTEAVTDTDTVTDTEGETETPPAPSENERPAEEVRVVSFNLDANEATIGERSERLMPLILSFEPDSIGVQEARGSWVSRLNRHLVKGGYTRVGVDAGGNENATGGYFATYIFYRTDKYKLIDSGTFWMSKTPDVPSIYDSTVDCNRTCTWALLENKTTGFRYVHMNTHLDWMNTEVNKIQVAMIREQIERFEAMGYPVFATGDYNCDEGTASYHEMLKSDVVGDSKHVAEKTMSLGTYPSYGQYDVTKTQPIDYVFVTKDMMEVHEYKVIDDKPEGKYVSDHNGLFVHATVKALPIVSGDRTVPQFENADLQVTPFNQTSATFSFQQAMDAVGNLASLYRVEVLDSAGKAISTASVSSGVLTLDPPKTVTGNIDGLSNAQSYTLRVTPISMLGDEGKSAETNFTFVFSTPDPDIDPEEMGQADIFALSVKDGKPVDTAGGMSVTEIGTTTISGTTHTFNGSSNYKIPGIADHYASLQDGFTLEICLTTGGDINTLQAPVANFHAGGFGTEIVDGQLRFGVHLGGSYQWVHTTVEANTTYHITAVYDKAAGATRLYVDGKLVDSKAVSGQMGLPGAQYLGIGADSGLEPSVADGENHFTGAIDAVRIYNTPATDGNALWLYRDLQA